MTKEDTPTLDAPKGSDVAVVETEASMGEGAKDGALRHKTETTVEQVITVSAMGQKEQEATKCRGGGKHDSPSRAGATSLSFFSSSKSTATSASSSGLSSDDGEEELVASTTEAMIDGILTEKKNSTTPNDEQGNSTEPIGASPGTFNNEVDIPIPRPVPQTQLARQRPGTMAAARPGAYSAGGELQRRADLDFTLVGDATDDLEHGGEPNSTNGGRAGTTTGEEVLAEATPVEEGAPPNLDAHAEPYDVNASQKRKAKGLRKQASYLMLMATIVLMLVLGVVIGVSVRKKDEKAVSMAPSITPSMAPSEAPSFAPTGPLDLFLQNLPASTLANLNNISTPQWKAQDWLSYHPQLETMPEWRKRQLFALVTLYHALEGPNWPDTVQDNWLLYDKSECFWFSNEFGRFERGEWQQLLRVNMTPCNEDDEFQLLLFYDLFLSHYKPFIPPEISFLTSLHLLNFADTEIHMPLAEFLPSTLYQMSSISYINLHTNKLTGPIPTEFGLMTKLDKLDLHGNSLTGRIPSELALMSSLVFLRPHVNNLSGPIPTEIGVMSNLVSLLLNTNELTGSLPSELGLITNLEQLHLWGNSLTGQIPSQVGLLDKLPYFGINDDGITGTIPSEVALMTSLRKLHIHSGGLTGRIPTEIGVMGNLTELVLYRHGMTGQIPSELGLLTRMYRFELFSNYLTGPIPSELAAVTTLSSVQLQDNALSGTIHSEIGLINNMRKLRLEANALTGLLPSQLGLLNRTTHLHLGKNRMFGEIPSELGMMASMIELSLNFNALSSTIPSQLSSISSLTRLWLNNNTLTGTTPTELNVLVFNGSLEVLALDGNNLSGTVSDELCSLWMLNTSAWDGLAPLIGLSFDCSDQFCGCCWCPCTGTQNSTNNTTTEECNPSSNVYIPSKEDPDWPGLFPTPLSTSNAVTINVRTDDNPEETTLEWSVRAEESGLWEVLDLMYPANANSLFSYTKQVDSDATYRLQLFDQYGDGSCCEHGFGWFTITTSIAHANVTNSTPSYDEAVIWNATGDVLSSSLSAFFQIDSAGHAHHVENAEE